MTDRTHASWFLDAWSVLDGYAFASLRRAGALQAEVTFFLAPPYFEPEPVASLATALAAARGHFQDGFRDAEGEVPFSSLGHVVEAVRRAYRAGGLDIDGTPPPSAPQPQEAPPGAVHPVDLVDESIRAIWYELRPALLADDTSTARTQHIESLLSKLTAAMLPALVPKCIGETLGVMLGRIAESECGRTKAGRDIGAWIGQARAAGIEVYVDARANRLTVHLVGESMGFEWYTPALDVRPDLHPFIDAVVESAAPAHRADLAVPFSVPFPAVFQPASGTERYPALPTFGHLLAAATADRHYIANVESAHELTPLIVVALTQLPATVLPHPRLPRRADDAETRAMCDGAARWLARALPSGLLAGHPVESALHALTVRLLRGPTDGGVTRRFSPA